MIQEVRMPKLGQTMEEAVIVKWRKERGDAVARGDVLLEIQTDKAVLEVESFVEGVFLERVAEEGDSFPVNAVIAIVGDPGDETPDVPALRAKALAAGDAAAEPRPEPAALSETESQPAAVAAPAPDGRIFASPRARRRAREEKVPLQVLQGSGPNGRIVEKDVIAYAEEIRSARPTPTARRIALQRGVDLRRVRGSGVGGRITKQDVHAASPAGEAIPLTGVQQIIAQRMAQSKREIPHFYLTAEIDMAAAVAMRKAINAEGAGRVAFHDLLVKACGQALAENPAVNVAYENGAVVARRGVSIGVAVAIDQGLMVPVIRDVDRLSLTAVAEASRELIEKARGKRLTPDEYQGGCLTISNLGMYGIDWFYPIINPGEVAIIGVGRIAEKVVALNGEVRVRPMMTVTLCADHRAVDGATAAAFFRRVKELLEAPEQLR